MGQTITILIAMKYPTDGLITFSNCAKGDPRPLPSLFCIPQAVQVLLMNAYVYRVHEWNDTTFTIRRTDRHELVVLDGARRLRYVYMQRNPSVFQIYIHHCALNGVPKTIRNLPELSKLTIRHCQLRYLDLNDFVSVPMLSVLDVSGNKIMSIVELATTARTVALQQLYLANNSLPLLNVSVFHGLTELRCLVLDGNRLERIESRLSLLTLEELSIRRNRLTTLDLTGWQLPALKFLFCNNNRLSTAPSGWTTLWQLETLDLSYNRLRGFCMDDLYLTQVRALNLAANELTNITTTQARLHLPLERFQAPHNRLRVLDISHWSMPNLWDFNVKRNRLSALGDVFFRFPNIASTMDLGYNPWSCEWLRRVHPGDLRRKQYGCMSTNHECPEGRVMVEGNLWMCCW
uniref:Leucine rich immune protein (Coil-less) n=1 Tax=Anopheles farauti TaxID=69004 RepID=A0A182QNE7_9DIPT